MLFEQKLLISGLDSMTFLYVILGIKGFYILLRVLYDNFNSATIDMPTKPEYEPRNNFPSSIQTNAYGANNRTTPSNNIPYSLGEPIGNQNERQENPGFNPAFNPTFNPAAIEMPPNPEYEARKNFPSNFQTNNYGANNHMSSASNLPYSLPPHWRS